jgi:hypothetical protein
VTVESTIVGRELGADAERIGEVNVIYGESSMREIAKLPESMRQIATQLTNWVQDTRSLAGRTNSLFDRHKYVSTDNPYDQMITARRAARDDDVVSGAAETTEGMALQGIKWEHSDWETQDIFNQMATEQDLDSVIRRMWREEFSTGCFVVAFYWDFGEFKVRGKSDKGNKRRSTKRVWYPRKVTLLDPTRVVPVGMLAFGQERLAWRATRNEIAAFNAIALGKYRDEIMELYYDGQYVVRDPDEQIELTRLRVDTSRLLLMDEELVRRHTLTKSDYERFAPVRLQSVFRLLDLKQQQMDADRAELVGAANYILLVKKGSKEQPGQPEEITNLRENYATLARIPVIFSDHRLEIEIISPKRDLTLQGEKYATLDGAIAARLLNVFSPPNSHSGQRTDTSLTLGRTISRSMENRRHMIRRFIEREMARAVVEHPKNAGIFEEGTPSLAFSPPRIQLEDASAVAQSVLALRTQREISRESVLEFFGFDQEVEAMRRELEKARFDDIFQTIVPFSSPNMNQSGGSVPADQAGAGAQGGRPTGGGKPTQNPTKAPKTSSSGATKGGPE